jgi:hypothetical protein
MIKNILLCLAAAPIVLCMWAVAFSMIKTALDLSRSPKYRAKGIKAYCERHIDGECKGCCFHTESDACKLDAAYPVQWEV